MTQTGVVYSRIIEGKTYTFGISGKLYKSNVLLYDHQTESLWSQLMNKAVAGSMAGNTLTVISSVRTSWRNWQDRHPETTVLSDNTGYERNYAVDPYEGYYRIGGLMFPVGTVRKDMSPKERVLGIELDGVAKAYALNRIRLKPGFIVDQLENRTVKIEIDAQGEIRDVTDADGNALPHVFSYWFAWQAFHPATEVY